MSTTVHLSDREGNWLAIGHTLGPVRIERARADDADAVSYSVARSFTMTANLHPRTLRNIDRLFGCGFLDRRRQRADAMRQWARRKGRRK